MSYQNYITRALLQECKLKHAPLTSTNMTSQRTSPASVGTAILDDDCLSGTAAEKSGSTRSTVRKESEHRRRLMMNQYYDELVALLSMVCDRITPRRTDKTSTLQETVNLIRLYHDLEGGVQGPNYSRSANYKPEFLNRGEVTSFLLDAFDAFLMVVSDNGCILYTTELITSLTGYIPTRIVGQSIYDCIHEDNCILMKSLFTPTPNNPSSSMNEAPIIIYPSKSFQCKFKMYATDVTAPSLYQEFSCLSYLRQRKETQEDSDRTSDNHFGQSSLSCLLLICKLSNSMGHIDMPITSNEVNFQFDLRISKEGKILDLSKHASLVLGYTCTELVGSLFFDYIDANHLTKLSESITMFLNKGLGVSKPYRFLTKSKRYIWVVSKGFLSYNPWNHKPDHVLLQCKVLGCDEILTEYRFLQDKKLQPDLTGSEVYIPEPIVACKVSSPDEYQPTNVAAAVKSASNMQQNLSTTPSSVQQQTHPQGLGNNNYLSSSHQSQIMTLLGQFSQQLHVQNQPSRDPNQAQAQYLSSQTQPQFSGSQTQPQFSGSQTQPQFYDSQTQSQFPGSQTQSQFPGPQTQSQLFHGSQSQPQFFSSQTQQALNQYSQSQTTLTQFQQPTSIQVPNQYPQSQTPTQPQILNQYPQTPVQSQIPIQYPQSHTQSDESKFAFLHSIDNIRKELEKKNHELFEMQKKIMEQQQLIEQERHQFYQITNQVMSYINSQQQKPSPPDTKPLTTPLESPAVHPYSVQNTNQQTTTSYQQSHPMGVVSSIPYNQQLPNMQPPHMLFPPHSQFSSAPVPPSLPGPLSSFASLAPEANQQSDHQPTHSTI